MALAYTGISIANTQPMATAGRAGELATLRSPEPRATNYDG
jgi:hypothetical protein